MQKIFQSLSENWIKRLLIFAYIGLALLLGMLVWSQMRLIQTQKHDLVSKQESLHAAKQEMLQLQKRLDFIGTEAYIEQMAREKYKFIKSNEFRYESLNE